MKTINLELSTLDDCVRESQNERVVITRNGIPVAIVVGLEGMDQEQAHLGSGGDFWKLISERRGEPTLTRAQLEQRIGEAD